MLALFLIFTGYSYTPGKSAVEKKDIVIYSTSSRVTESNQIKTFIESIDLKQNNIRKLYEIDYSSQYPLIVARENKYYYTRSNNNSKRDELWLYDSEKHEKTLVSNKFLAINDIFPRIKDIIIIGVNPEEGQELGAYSFSENNTLKKFDFGFDFSVSLAHYDPMTDDVLLYGFFLVKKLR